MNKKTNPKDFRYMVFDENSKIWKNATIIVFEIEKEAGNHCRMRNKESNKKCDWVFFNTPKLEPIIKRWKP